MPRRRSFLGLATFLGAAAVDSQFISGGIVNMTCGMCACEGNTNAGDQVLVYDNPSTGNRVSATGHTLNGILRTMHEPEDA